MRGVRASLVSFLLIFFITLPHFAFSFKSNGDKLLPEPHWVEAQNRDALQRWQDAAGEAPDENFVTAPLQETRTRALSEPSRVFKEAAFPKEEEINALNALKVSMLENNAHQTAIQYEEYLFKEASREAARDSKQLAGQYHVKLKNIESSNGRKILKLKKRLLKKFHAGKNIGGADFKAEENGVSLSGLSFKGKWRDKFEASHIREGEFKGRPAAVFIPMMLKTGYHGYFEEDTFQALDLRYGDGKVSFLIFLPKAGTDLTAFYAALNFENWSQWMTEFIEREGSLRIPRFRIETLSRSGSQLTVFENAAKGGKDFFRYDMTEVLGVDDAFQFDADRPFFFAVRDNETDLILLLGQFVDPAASS